MVTIIDVAQHAGVSIATVSRVLNETGTVSPALAERVRASVAALQFSPSRAARTLRASRSRLIGLLVTDLQNAFYLHLARGAEAVAQRNGYSLLLCNSEEDPRKERAYIEVLCAEHVAGVILAPTRERVPALRLFRERGIPVVAVDRRVQGSDIDAVLLDNVGGACEAVTHLITNGYRRIGVLTGPQTTTTGRERLLGYRQALRSADIGNDPDLERCGLFTEESGQTMAAALLDLAAPPDALFATNNRLTMGALEELHARNLHTPDDIGVVGFDDMPWARISTISLTTVTQPVYELGGAAATRLMQRLQTAGTLARQEIILAARLDVRGTSLSRVGGRAETGEPRGSTTPRARDKAQATTGP